LAAGLALLGAVIVVALAPLGGGLTTGMSAVSRDGWGRLGDTHIPVLVVAVGLTTWLVMVLVHRFLATLWARRRHRRLLDLVADPWPGQAGGRVLAHPRAVAYCLPGTDSRVVLSSGALDLLDEAELAAVIAHERAHLAERHDLVVLPFTAWRTALPVLPGVRRARSAVATLVEMVADDRACAVCDRLALATALARVGAGGAPDGALAVSGGATVERVRRLLDPPPPSKAIRWSAYAASAALLAGPVFALLAG
jgi:Zn-dependent protease with chaperone function